MRVPLLSILLCVMVAVESVTIKYVQKNQRQKIPSEQLVFLVEVFKLIVSAALYFGLNKQTIRTAPPLRADTRSENSRLISSTDETNEDDDVLERRNTSSIIWFILPSFLYAVSNNVTFAALMLMSPALFNLLMNLKIPMTGIMACSLLHYHLTPSLGISFIFLFLGSIFATLKWSADGSLDVEGSVYGLVLMFVYALCSAGAAVYTEYVTKTRYPNESMHLQNIKYCTCSMVANVLIMAVRGQVPFTMLEPLHLASIFALAMNGLVTAGVLKFAGSIVKTYAVSCAAFLSALLTWFLFHTTLHWNFYVGCVICALSVQLYLYERNR